MKETELIQLALMLTPPWKVMGCQFDVNQKRLDIHIDFAKGSLFSCPVCGQTDCVVHDTEPKSWRHLNFFQHEAFLNARVPRIRCKKCGVRVINVPWAREGSGFTLLFEAYFMLMAPSMPVQRIAELVGEHDTRLWRILHHHVNEAREKADFPMSVKSESMRPPASADIITLPLLWTLKNQKLSLQQKARAVRRLIVLKRTWSSMAETLSQLVMSAVICPLHSSKGCRRAFPTQTSPLINSM
jgi:hypothetical protein